MIEMKKLKIFAWLCTGIALLCWLEACYTFEIIVWYDEYHWALAALCFSLAAILSWLTVWALKELREQLELKILMSK
jgi:hypothetical protein